MDTTDTSTDTETTTATDRGTTTDTSGTGTTADRAAATREVDETLLEEFVGRFAGDLGAIMHAATVLVGDRLGLYRAMADGEPVTASTLSERTGCDERWLAEWLAAQAASGYAEHDPGSGAYHLTPEQAFALSSEDNPLFAPGGLQVAASTMKDAALIAEAGRTGAGIDWGRHDPDLFAGTDRFFRPTYIGSLVQDWLPALDGVVEVLEQGARVVDVGCGYGSSTVLMARAFPRSTFLGVDAHGPSVAHATEAARERGVADRCDFEVATATEYAARDADLVTSFDCFHDMGDPGAVAAHVRESLTPEGTWMLVEPNAGDRVADNLGPVGRIFYAASTLICVPSAMSQGGRDPLGAQAGPRRTESVVREGGFTRFRRAAETPFNLVYEARP